MHCSCCSVLLLLLLVVVPVSRACCDRVHLDADFWVLQRLLQQLLQRLLLRRRRPLLSRKDSPCSAQRVAVLVRVSFVSR